MKINERTIKTILERYPTTPHLDLADQIGVTYEQLVKMLSHLRKRGFVLPAKKRKRGLTFKEKLDIAIDSYLEERKKSHDEFEEHENEQVY